MHKQAVSLVAVLAVLMGLALGGLVQAEESKPAYLGVMTAKPEDGKSGAWVREVTPDSPAAKAGLQNGDVVVKVDGKEIADPAALVEAISARKPGDKIKLTVVRDGKEQEIEATLSERPVRRPQVRAFPEPVLPRPLAPQRGAYLGIYMQEITPELKEKLGLTVDQGVVVTEVTPDSPAAKAGLKADDVITGVGDKQIAGPEELRDVISKSKPGSEVVLHVHRGKEKMELKATLGEAPAALGFEQPFPLPEGFRPFRFDQFRDLFENRLPGEIRRFTFDLEKFEQMHKDMLKRIEELEKRITELEKQRK
ncbi:MAG: PDZ domain-containing protein [Gemmatales bacterium]|nr:PDZ domain-containing protein [Gemmatales bacterium]MDW8388115.1 PDZ domain-containing protein [Gemmatales bacterium]